MSEEEKLVLVEQAMIGLERLSDSTVTPLAVMAWLTLHANLDLTVDEICRCMEMLALRREASTQGPLSLDIE